MAVSKGRGCVVVPWRYADWRFAVRLPLALAVLPPQYFETKEAHGLFVKGPQLVLVSKAAAAEASSPAAASSEPSPPSKPASRLEELRARKAAANKRIEKKGLVPAKAKPATPQSARTPASAQGSAIPRKSRTGQSTARRTLRSSSPGGDEEGAARETPTKEVPTSAVKRTAAQVVKLRTTLAEQGAELAAAQSALQQYKRQAAAERGELEAQLQAAQDAVREVQAARDQAAAQSGELQAQLEQVTAQLAAATEAAREAERAQPAAATDASSTTSSDSDSDSGSGSDDEGEDVASAVERVREEAAAELSASQEKVAALQASVQRHEAESARAKAEAEEARAACQAAKEELAQQRSAWKAEAERAAQAAAEAETSANATIAELRQRLAESATAVAEADAELDEAHQEASDAALLTPAKAVREVELAAATTARKLTRRAAEAEEEVARLQAALENANLDKEEAVLERDIAQEMALEAEAGAAKAAEALAAAQLELTQLRAEASAGGDGGGDVLRAQNIQLREALATLRQATAAERRSLERRVDELATAAAGADAARQEAAASAGTVAELKAEMAELHEYVDAASAYESMVEALSDKNLALGERLAAVKATLQDTRALLQATEDIEQEQVLSIRHLQGCLHSERERSAQLQQAIARACAAEAEARTSAGRYAVALESLRTRFRRVATELRTAHESQSERQARMRRILSAGLTSQTALRSAAALWMAAEADATLAPAAWEAPLGGALVPKPVQHALHPLVTLVQPALVLAAATRQAEQHVLTHCGGGGGGVHLLLSSSAEPPTAVWEQAAPAYLDMQRGLAVCRLLAAAGQVALHVAGLVCGGLFPGGQEVKPGALQKLMDEGAAPLQRMVSLVRQVLQCLLHGGEGARPLLRHASDAEGPAVLLFAPGANVASAAQAVHDMSDAPVWSALADVLLASARLHVSCVEAVASPAAGDGEADAPPPLALRLPLTPSPLGPLPAADLPVMLAGTVSHRLLSGSSRVAGLWGQVSASAALVAAVTPHAPPLAALRQVKSDVAALHACLVSTVHHIAGEGATCLATHAGGSSGQGVPAATAPQLSELPSCIAQHCKMLHAAPTAGQEGALRSSVQALLAAAGSEEAQAPHWAPFLLLAPLARTASVARGTFDTAATHAAMEAFAEALHAAEGAVGDLFVSVEGAVREARAAAQAAEVAAAEQPPGEGWVSDDEGSEDEPLMDESLWQGVTSTLAAASAALGGAHTAAAEMRDALQPCTVLSAQPALASQERDEPAFTHSSAVPTWVQGVLDAVRKVRRTEAALTSLSVAHEAHAETAQALKQQEELTRQANLRTEQLSQRLAASTAQARALARAQEAAGSLQAALQRQGQETAAAIAALREQNEATRAALARANGLLRGEEGGAEGQHQASGEAGVTALLNAVHSANASVLPLRLALSAALEAAGSAVGTSLDCRVSSMCPLASPTPLAVADVQQVSGAWSGLRAAAQRRLKPRQGAPQGATA